MVLSKYEKDFDTRTGEKRKQTLVRNKKRGFGSGLWNGFGGKVEAGESIAESLIRECKEEASITPTAFERVGIMEFSFVDDSDILEVHIFNIKEYLGEPTESEEMKSQWFDVTELPFEQMWPDDERWLPYFLAGETFTGSVRFTKPADDTGASEIITCQIKKVKNL